MPFWEKYVSSDFKKYGYRKVSYREAINFILPRHYAGRAPQVSHAFGAFVHGKLVACITFGMPATPALCPAVCGEQNAKYVIELNRICVDGTLPVTLSHFVSYCLAQVAPAIVVSYSDTGMGHVGYIYQACNFIYTGKTRERHDRYAGEGKHARHGDASSNLYVVRTPKHRYVYFSVKGCSKALRKSWMRELRWPIVSYPKDVSHRYTLGEFQKQEIVTSI